MSKEKVTVIMPSELAMRVRGACTRDLKIPDIYEQAVRMWFSVRERRDPSWVQRLASRLFRLDLDE